MLPPADKSQAAPACAGRGALEVSRSPRQRCLYLILIFYFNSDQLHGGFERSRQQRWGRVSAHNQPLSTLLLMSQSKWLLWEVELMVLAVTPTNDTDTRACWKWCLHYQTWQQPTYPSILRMERCQTSLTLFDQHLDTSNSSSLFSAEQTPNVFSFKS